MAGKGQKVEDGKALKSNGDLAKADGAITLEQAAALLKLTPRRVQQLASEGWIKKQSSRGGYSVTSVVHGYVDYLQDEARRSSKSASQSRVSDRRAEEIEMRMIERSKALIQHAAAEAISIVDEVVGGIRADLMAVPARVTADLEIRRKIELAHDEVVRQAAKRSSDRSKGVEPGLDPADADAEDDA